MAKEAERGFSYLESVERGKVFRRLRAEGWAVSVAEAYRQVDEAMGDDYE